MRFILLFIIASRSNVDIDIARRADDGGTVDSGTVDGGAIDGGSVVHRAVYGCGCCLRRRCPSFCVRAPLLSIMPIGGVSLHMKNQCGNQDTLHEQCPAVTRRHKGRLGASAPAHRILGNHKGRPGSVEAPGPLEPSAIIKVARGAKLPVHWSPRRS
jgi:hypothetical protein